VTTRGKYYPDTALATERDPPLYLHITATTPTALERASRMVQDLIDRDLGSLVDERRFRRTDERDEFGRRKWPEEKIPINMESMRGFNVRAQIVGPGVHPCPHSNIFFPVFRKRWFFERPDCRVRTSSIFQQRQERGCRSKVKIPASWNRQRVVKAMNLLIYMSRTCPLS